MLSEHAIRFDHVRKKFSKSPNQFGTLRDNISTLFKRKRSHDRLNDNEFFALKDVSFEIKHGACIGLYGPNGSGKSTLLKLIANVISPTSGRIEINGHIAPLIELGAGFHPDLNGYENIYMNGAILGMTIGEIKKKMDQIIEYSGLRDFITTPVKKYSSGMKLRLGFSVAIHSEADIFLFDEVLAVGDEEFKEKSFNSIKDLLKRDKTLIVVSHDMDNLSQFVDDIIYLKKGIIQNKNI